MMARPDRWLVAACLVYLAQPAAFSKDFEHHAGATARSPVMAATAEAPMCFEQNVGQSDERVAFLARGSGCGIFLTADELVLSLGRPAPEETARRAGPDLALEQMRHPRAERRAEPAAPAAVLRMRLVGASAATPVGEQQLVTRTNYFLGNDPDRWHTDVPNFARVRYPEVLPGVDVVYYGRGGQLEYDEVVAPGADPRGIVMEWDGADSIDVDETGALVLKAGEVELRQHTPVLYQETEMGRAEVAGRFLALGGRRVGVEVGDYDATRPLVIDPVLAYSTYLGGSNRDYGQSIAVDSSGAAYVLGETNSIDFPTQNAYDATFLGGLDLFVTKLDPSGSTVIYSTYLGGSPGVIANVYAGGIAVDPNGAAYVLGNVTSSNFPTTQNAYDPTYNGSSDAVVAKLGPAGNSLVYSTYLGGPNNERGSGIAVDVSGAAYLTGLAGLGFPTKNAYDATYNGGGDAFVTKLAPSGSTLVYSTFLGGTALDMTWAIALDWAGQAYVTGQTDSSDFPTHNALNATLSGGPDAFVTKLSSSGIVVYSTYLGGTDYDAGHAIAVDIFGAAYVTGFTGSVIFPTLTSSFDPLYNGNCDVFVTKLNPAGNSLVYSTYLGGSSWEAGYGIAVDSSGAAYVTGGSNSTDFPMLNPYDATVGLNDAFVTKLDPGGRTLAYSTYLGGADNDDGANAIAVDASGAVYVTGWTDALTFPTTAGAFDQTYNGNPLDAFVTKLQ